MSISRPRLSKQRACRKAANQLKGQTRRLVQFLAANSEALTAEVAVSCSIGNVSDAAIRANEQLQPLGWRIVGRLPDPRSVTRFGEPSNQFLWSIVRVR